MPSIISCLTNSYGRFGVEGAIQKLPAAGITALELPIRTAGVTPYFGDTPLLTNASGDAEIQAAQKLIADHGMDVVSCNVTSGNPLEADVVEITNRKLDIAARFGVALVVGGAGEAEDDDQRNRLYDHLRQIGDHAASLGITYCFETHPGICQNHYGMLETMEALDHPHLRLNFDTANILYYNQQIDVEIALARVCQYVRHIHLKDSQGEFGKWYFPALGDGGAVNFVRVLEIMRPLGFRGPYSLEIEGIAGEGELTLDQHHERIADSMAHLQRCGYLD